MKKAVILIITLAIGIIAGNLMSGNDAKVKDLQTELTKTKKVLEQRTKRLDSCRAEVKKLNFELSGYKSTAEVYKFRAKSFAYMLGLNNQDWNVEKTFGVPTIEIKTE